MLLLKSLLSSQNLFLEEFKMSCHQMILILFTRDRWLGEPCHWTTMEPAQALDIFCHKFCAILSNHALFPPSISWCHWSISEDHDNDL